MNEKVKQRMLEITLAKVKHHNKRVWCGCFRADEILQLMEMGAMNSIDK